MRVLTACLELLVFGGAIWGQGTVPVGVILTADDSFVQLPGVETWLTAAPGEALLPGYRVRTGSGTVRFAFCPDRTAYTLLPGHELTIPSLQLPITTGMFGNVRKLAFCDLPNVPARQTAGGGNLRFVPSTGPKVDLLDSIQRANVLTSRGDRAAALAEYNRIVSDYPEAVWARGVIVAHKPESTTNPQGKTFALLIGVSKYPKESPLGNLMYADADAQSFAEFLQTPKGGDVPASQIKLLLNSEATRDGIDSAVRMFVNQAAGKQNTLILFIAGHGHFLTTNRDPETGAILGRDPYIVTADVYRQDVKTTGYPMSEFRNLIAEETLHFGRVIVYVDVCHAGYVRDEPSEQGLQPAVKRVFSDRQGNIGLMMAAEANKFAYEASEFGGHGAFTYAVLDGLNGGAAHRNDPRITFADLFRHVVDDVGELTNNTQSPDKFVNDDQMPVLDDVTKEPGISLPKANPLTEAATRRRRGAVLQVVDELGQSPISHAFSAFEALVKKDPLAALPEYAAIANDPSVPEETKLQRTEILRVALEEHGQRILIQYLHGEQIPQTKAEFDLCGRYFDEALRLPQATTFDESRMWFCRGRALIFDHDEGRYQEAVRLLERSILLDSDHAYAYNALGIAYLEQVRTHPSYYERSIAAFHDALRFAPEWAYPMHNLALAYAEQGNFASAVASYRQAMRLAPAYSYLPYNLALLNQRMNRLGDAENLYRMALREADEARSSGLVPPVAPWSERANILNALGTVAVAKHRYKAAQDYYEQALSEDFQLAGAKFNLAVLLSRKELSLRAVQLWRENISADPTVPTSRLALAEYFARNGDKNGAIREYEAAVQVAPNHTGARRELARLYAGGNRWQEAYNQLREARKQIPDHAGIAEEYGDAAIKLGRVAEGAAVYRDAARLYHDKQDRKRVQAKLSSIAKLQ